MNLLRSSTPPPLIVLQFFTVHEDFSLVRGKMKIRAALQRPTKPMGGGEFSQRRRERKINVGFCSGNLSPVSQAFPECGRLLQRPIVESFQMCGESLTGALPSTETFRPELR